MIHKYLLHTDKENIFTEYGHRYNKETCKEMFGTFTEELDAYVGINVANAIKSMTKGNEWSHGMLCIGHLATSPASTLIIWKDNYYISAAHDTSRCSRPVDKGTLVTVYSKKKVLRFSLTKCCLLLNPTYKMWQNFIIWLFVHLTLHIVRKMQPYYMWRNFVIC